MEFSNVKAITIDGNKDVLKIEKDNVILWSKKFKVIVSSNNTDYGTVSGSGDYNYGSQATIKATPHEDTTSYTYEFKQWSDGNTSKNRTIIVNSDITLTATFNRTSKKK